MENLFGEWEGKRIAKVGLKADPARPNYVSNTKVETPKL
jgi:hypothetical protein